MACICTKPKGSCPKCEHFRYDEDYGAKACFLAADLKKESPVYPAAARVEPVEEEECMYPNALVGMNAYHGTAAHECPLGGDIENDCADCAYAGDYHYDYEKRDCVLRDAT